ncbi:MAG TPA: hypothetical protein VJ859_02115 [Allosphingosinicella sp.]|nr:hypothetical protein [Allosphingosinicella sp.]
MARSTSQWVLLAATAAALALGGCGRKTDDADLARLDNQIVGNEADPALTGALQDQIMVDPTLSQQSNRNAVRPPQSPSQAQYPGGRGAASLRGSLADGAACGSNFDYAMHWANRLPAAFAVYPNGKVTEAAANNRGECRVRVVTFVSSDAPGRLLDWYQRRATDAGYSAERQQRGADQVLAGTNERDGGAYFLIVTPRGAGSDVAIITNQGK